MSLIEETIARITAPDAEMQAKAHERMQQLTMPTGALQTLTDMAERLGISQSAYAQQEAVERPRKATREKIAKAMKIAADLLDF